MALSSLKISTKTANEGQWFDVGTMSFRVKRSNTNTAEKIRQFKSKNIADDSAALNKFVFNELVTDWRNVSESTLQHYIISDNFYDKDGWFDLAGIQFKMKRATLKDLVELQKVGVSAAKLQKSIKRFILDWKGFQLKEGEPEIEFSQAKAVEILTKEEWSEAASQILQLAYDTDRYAVNNVSEADIEFNAFAVQKYFVDADRNDITEQIINFAKNNENFFEEEVAENIESAKKR